MSMGRYLYAAVCILLLFQAIDSGNRSDGNVQCYSDHVRLPEWLYLGHSRDVCPVATFNGTPFSQSSLPPVDFIFLIEHSQMVNATYLHYFNTALHSLQGRAHGSADISFAVIIYSLEQPVPILHVRDFQPIPDDFNLKNTVGQITELETNNANENTHYSSKEIDYLAVNKALQMLNAVMSGDTLTDNNGLSHNIFPRPLSSVHIIVGLGLYQKRAEGYNRTVSVAARRKSIDKNMDLILEHTQTVPNVALHFFFARDIHRAVEFIGSSRHEVRYRDCTHLNKALTLRSLLDAKHEASSLQAHMLALGRDIHVMDLSALTRADCIQAISPILWSGFDLNVNHIDKCSDKCSGRKDKKCCFDGSYCSPLHGCVREPLSPSRAQNPLPSDKMPLTGHLVMSHADLVKPTDSSESSTTEGDYPTEKLTIVKAADPTAPLFPLSDVVVGKPHILKWSPDREFAEKLIKKGKPVLLKNSVVKTWPAMETWNFAYLSHNMGTDTLQLVKCTDNFLTFDPDKTAALKLKIALPFTETNMSTSSFFSCIQEPSHCPDGMRGHYYFGSVPEMLQSDLSPTQMLYRTTRDYKASKQFMWVSSSGMITHAHFDQDLNFFVQLIGKKRFTLWPSSQHELMYMYPRVHPLWHKSRLNFRAPDMTRFPNFAKSRALQVVVEPGDVLYVPPYTWHYVETLSPSVSLSTWSHDYDLYDHMNAIYRHDHKFDLIEDPRGQMFALRLYLDMMIHDLYGFNQTTNFFIKLLTNRFTGLEHLFPPDKDDPHICSATIQNKIPTCVHVHGYAKLDMAVVGEHFQAFQPEIRDILFHDYVEEITAQVVGVRKMLAFFRFCFLGQDYYVTELGDEEHALWDHKDHSNDNSHT